MLAWLGVVGNAVDFIGQTLIGKRLDLPLDQKHRAAAAFLSLYNCMCDLTICTQKVIQVMTPSGNTHKPVIFSKAIIELAPEIEKVSAEFVKAADRLTPVLTICDPTLAQLFLCVFEFKRGYTSLFSALCHYAYFKIDFKAARHLEKIRYNYPNELLRNIDVGEYYSKLLRPELNEGSGESSRYRLDRFGYTVNRFKEMLKSNTLNEEIGPMDVELITAFGLHLESHLMTVRKAQESLRRFIAQTFSIEDLLYRA
jgi:hypothetical protein